MTRRYREIRTKLKKLANTPVFDPFTPISPAGYSSSGYLPYMNLLGEIAEDIIGLDEDSRDYKRLLKRGLPHDVHQTIFTYQLRQRPQPR